MDYENEPWMKVYKRDTAGWAALSVFARGVSLELGRYLDAKGELPLGRRGLPAVAATLRCAWEEIEPFVRELLADNRLVHDEARQVLIDPQHAARQQARANAATRKRMERDKKKASRDVTRSHTRSRGVTNRSEEKRSEETLPSGEVARAHESSPAAPEIEPETPEPEREPDAVTLDAPMPDWAAARVESIQMASGVTLDGPMIWSKYVSNRLDPTNPKPVNAFDFNGWLCNQVRIERRDREREREWTAPRAAASGYLPRGNLLPRDTPPAPYHVAADELEAERDDWAEQAGTLEERKAAAAAAMAAFG